MAYLRFRGNTTQLLATVWQDGRNKQIVLLNLRGAMSITKNMREVVAANFPDVSVDWPEIERALIAGPPSVNPETELLKEIAQVAQRLYDWSLRPGLTTVDEKKLLVDTALLLSKLASSQLARD